MDQTRQSTPPPSAEVSLKYMAWNVKQMDANLKRIADAVEMIVQTMKIAAPSGYDSRKAPPDYVQGEIPF